MVAIATDDRLSLFVKTQMDRVRGLPYLAPLKHDVDFLIVGLENSHCPCIHQHREQRSSHRHFFVIFRRVTNLRWATLTSICKERRQWPLCSVHSLGRGKT